MQPMSEGPRTPPGQHLLSVLRLFLSALIALWVIDVAVNLELLKGVLLREPVHGALRDYVGLLLAEVQIALAVAVLGFLLACAAARTRIGRDRAGDAVVFLSALIGAITVLGGTKVAWSFGLGEMRVAFVIAAVAGLAFWLILRAVANRRPPRDWTFAEMVQWALLPALAIGFANDALSEATRAEWSEAGISGVAALLLLVLALISRRARSSRQGLCIRWVPVFVAVFLAVCSCVSARLYGTPGGGEGLEGAERGARVTGEGVQGGARDVRAGGGGVRTDAPDIILIVLDTVRADHLKSFGYTRDTMPALERWARGALSGKRVISPSGWTIPAHASIFSGRTVSLHGIHSAPEKEGRTLSLRTMSFENIPWLPEVLASEGYYCLAVSANALAVPSEVTGFHRVLLSRRSGWFDLTVAALVDRVSPLTRRISDRMRWRMPYVDAEGIVDITMRAVPDEEPVFLFVNFLEAHSPYNPPVRALKLLGAKAPRLFSRYETHRPLTKRWRSLPDGKAEYLADLYDGELRWLDLNLERLLQWIDERFGDDAVVIVTSDHGEELGEEGRVGHEYGLSQGLIHVPLFVRGPGLPPGELEEFVTLRSLYDFICSCAAGETPDVAVLARVDEHGMISERYPSGHNANVLGEAYERSWVSLIEGNRKAVGPSDHGLELYDIETAGFDREVPVSDSLGEKMLGARVDGYWEEFRDTREEALESLTDDEIRQLRALGYVQ